MIEETLKKWSNFVHLFFAGPVTNDDMKASFIPVPSS